MASDDERLCVYVCAFHLLLLLFFSFPHICTYIHTYSNLQESPRKQGSCKHNEPGFFSIHTYTHFQDIGAIGMVNKDGAEVRKERIEHVTKRVLQWLNENKEGEITLSKALAELEAETGNTRERLREYLKNGYDRARFDIDWTNDKIKSICKVTS
jgi:hypothetical protein